ncbi:MAG TPA: hypothetical protein VGN72_16455 [Tepidisphaeraceae bacterium]|jgi:hypothetical protein|nr:hypothetical protein [Tepidisphaeraceae bacterium]
MSTVEEIKEAIDRLTPEERAKLERMLHGDADDEWDRQMRDDAEAGRLDFMIKQVDEDIEAGRVRDLP